MKNQYSIEPGKHEKPERNRDIYVRRKRGETFRSIGDRYDITLERVRQLYQREYWRARGIRFRSQWPDGWEVVNINTKQTVMVFGTLADAVAWAKAMPEANEACGG